MRSLWLLLLLPASVSAEWGDAFRRAKIPAGLREDFRDTTKMSPAGGVVVHPKAAPMPVREVRPAATFPAGTPRVEGHNCYRCGASQYVISGWLSSGEHTHTCARCGAVWKH